MSIEDRMETICDGALRHFKADNQMLKAIEELSECSAAISRLLADFMLADDCTEDSANEELLDGFVEEVVDATIMICQMTLLAEYLAPGSFTNALSDKLDYLELLLPEEFHADE